MYQFKLRIFWDAEDKITIKHLVTQFKLIVVITTQAKTQTLKQQEPLQLGIIIQTTSQTQ